VSHWDRRFFESTRGQIVTLLRRTRQTVDDLAAALRLTDNAVRAHLVRLERDGLVRQRGVRRGERRPSLVYELTPDAELLFPKAYLPAMRRLLEVVADRCSSQEFEQVVREVGQRLSEGHAAPSGTPRERLQAAAAVLSAIGGLAEVDSDLDGHLELRGLSCPLGELVPGHPEVCILAEALVTQVSGLAVHQRCERAPGEPARCRFELDQRATRGGRRITPAPRPRAR
jgi:predicted ArsR family transcriptional regulator